MTKIIRIEVLEWLANLFIMVPVAILAISPELAQSSWLLFIALTIGNLLWLTSGIILKKHSIFISAGFFACLNGYATLIRLHPEYTIHLSTIQAFFQ